MKIFFSSNRKMEERPEYTEYGFKIHKLRLTLKVHKRPGQQDDPPRPASTSDLYSEPVRRNTRRRARSTRTNSTASSLADSLKQLDLDPVAGSRRPCQEKTSTKLANWEFQGFYNGVQPPVSSPGVQTMVSTPSSGYSSAAVSRTSSFSFDPQLKQLNHCPRSTRLSSADDSAYSEVYSTIDELSELPDPFDDPTEGSTPPQESSPIFCSLPPNNSPSTSKSATLKISHSKTASNVTTATTSTLSANSANMVVMATNSNDSSHSRNSSQSRKASAEKLYQPSHSEFDFPPPLPPRITNCRPPARPPYPSSIVRAVQEITKPLER